MVKYIVFILIVLGIGFAIECISAEETVVGSIEADDFYLKYSDNVWADCKGSSTASTRYQSTRIDVSAAWRSPSYTIQRGGAYFNVTGFNNSMIIDYVNLSFYVSYQVETDDNGLFFYNSTTKWNENTADYNDIISAEGLGSVAGIDSTGWYYLNLSSAAVNKIKWDITNNQVIQLGIVHYEDALDSAPSGNNYVRIAVDATYDFNMTIGWHIIQPGEDPLDGGEGWRIFSHCTNGTKGEGDVWFIGLGNNYTWAQASANGIIIPYAYEWNEASQTYQWVTTFSGYRGYWLYFYDFDYELYSDVASGGSGSGPGTNLTGFDVGRVLWLQMENDSSTQYDMSGNGNHGTVIGAERTPMGAYGYGMMFRGEGDRVNVSHSDSINITGNRSVSCWVYCRDDSRQPFVAKNKMCFLQWYKTDLGLQRSFEGGLWNVSGNWRRANYSWSDPSDFWHHIVMTYNKTDGNISLYKDGQFVSNFTTESGDTVWSTDNLVIGNKYFGSGKWEMYGVIDEVMVWNRTLNATEINELFGQHGFNPINEGNGIFTAGVELEEETQMLLVLIFLWYCLLKLSRTYVYLPFILGILQWSFVGAYYALIDNSSFVALLMLIGFFFFLLGVYKTYKGM